MDWIQLGVTIAAFLIIFLHQRHKIGALEKANKTQSGLLENMERLVNSFATMANPELMAGRAEFYEKLVEKQKDIALKELEDRYTMELEHEMKTAGEVQLDLLGFFRNTMRALFTAMGYLSHSQRSKVVEAVPDKEFKGLLESLLPIMLQFDEESRKVMAKAYAEALRDPSVRPK